MVEEPDGRRRRSTSIENVCRGPRGSIRARPTRSSAARSPLPPGAGKNVHVAVFATGDCRRPAHESEADLVSADDLAAQVEAGDRNFDVRNITTPDMMPLVDRLGQHLGPRGLIPNPKTSTITNDVGRAVWGAEDGQGQE